MSTAIMEHPTASTDMITITYRDAMKAAIKDAIERDDRVFLMGEDVGMYGGGFAVSKGLLAELGPDRIMDTPLSESAFVGAGIGAAMCGMRPIVEIMTVNFSLFALDQIHEQCRHCSAYVGWAIQCSGGDPDGDWFGSAIGGSALA